MKGVVIEHKDFRSSIIRFKDQEEDQLEKFIKLSLKKKFTVYIIDCLHSTPPPDNHQPRRRSHIYWCPYCANDRKFIPWYNYRRCEICNVSDFEFYVRKYNKLDHKIRGEE